MTQDPRITTIKIPNVGDTVATVLDDVIIFVLIDYEQGSENPLEAWHAMGRITSCNYADRWSQQYQSPEEVEEYLLYDADTVPLVRGGSGDGMRWTAKSRPTGQILEFGRIDGFWEPDEDTCREAQEAGHAVGTPERLAFMFGRAESTARVYSQWCNGEVYYFRVEAYRVRRDDDGEPFDEEHDYRRDTPLFEESCGGIYEDDDDKYIERTLQAETFPSLLTSVFPVSTEVAG